MDNPLDASSPATPHDLLIDVQPDAPPDAMPANESQDHVRAARITSQADELLREMLAKEQYDSVCRENETLRQALRNSQQAVRDWQQELCDYKQLAETTLLQVRTALERENDTLRQALRTVQSALERENELLRSKMEPTVQPLPGEGGGCGGGSVLHYDYIVLQGCRKYKNCFLPSWTRWAKKYGKTFPARARSRCALTRRKKALTLSKNIEQLFRPAISVRFFISTNSLSKCKFFFEHHGCCLYAHPCFRQVSSIVEQRMRALARDACDWRISVHPDETGGEVETEENKEKVDLDQLVPFCLV